MLAGCRLTLPRVPAHPHPWRSVLCAVGALAMLAPGLASAQFNDAPYNERPAEATVVIQNSHRYEGRYELNTLARVCGEVPAEMNFAGVPVFTVQFYPESGQGAIRDITFSSKELVGGITDSSSFHLSVIVYSPAIGSPPAYVLDTSRPGVSGEARLVASEKGTHELSIDGVNEMDERIQLTLKCQPRA